jgi:hypothetical protein
METKLVDITLSQVAELVATIAVASLATSALILLAGYLFAKSKGWL